MTKRNRKKRAKVPAAKPKQKTGFDKFFDDQMKDKEFAARYEEVKKEIDEEIKMSNTGYVPEHVRLGVRPQKAELSDDHLPQSLNDDLVSTPKVRNLGVYKRPEDPKIVPVIDDYVIEEEQSTVALSYEGSAFPNANSQEFLDDNQTIQNPIPILKEADRIAREFEASEEIVEEEYEPDKIETILMSDPGTFLLFVSGELVMQDKAITVIEQAIDHILQKFKLASDNIVVLYRMNLKVGPTVY